MNGREAREAIAAALLCTCIAGTVSAHAAQEAREQAPGASSPQQAAPANAPGSAAQGAVQDPAERIIAVARDVSPEWASSLEKVRARDPAGFERATGVLAKRLKALAVLKDRKPQLYALRVEELRIQGEVTALADQWRSAISTGRTEDAAGIESTLRSKVGVMVDLNLRSRAMELAELDEVMRSMRGDLERDARARDTTVDEAIEAYRRGEEPAIGRSPVTISPPGSASHAADPKPDSAPAKGPRGNAPGQPDAEKSSGAPASGASAPQAPAAPAPAQGTP